MMNPEMKCETFVFLLSSHLILPPFSRQQQHQWSNFLPNSHPHTQKLKGCDKHPFRGEIKDLARSQCCFSSHLCASLPSASHRTHPDPVFRFKRVSNFLTVMSWKTYKKDFLSSPPHHQQAIDAGSSPHRTIPP